MLLHRALRPFGATATGAVIVLTCCARQDHAPRHHYLFCSRPPVLDSPHAKDAIANIGYWRIGFFYAMERYMWGFVNDLFGVCAAGGLAATWGLECIPWSAGAG